MPFGIYKQGQGRWSRGVAAAGLAAIGIWACLETFNWMENYDPWLRFGVPGVILAACLWGAYYTANRPRVADFLVETETEMKKVTWPSTREVLSATAVVIVVVILLAAFLFGVDRVLIQPFFQLIGLLPKAAG